MGVIAEVCVFEAGRVADELLPVSPLQLAKNTVQASSSAMRNKGWSFKSGVFFNFSPPLVSRISACSLFGDLVGCFLFSIRIAGLLYSIGIDIATQASQAPRAVE